MKDTMDDTMDDGTLDDLEHLEQRVARIRALVENTKNEHRAHELVETANLMLKMCLANYEYAITQNGKEED